MTNNKKEYKVKSYYFERSDQKYEARKEFIASAPSLHFHDYLEAELILEGTANQFINDYKTPIKPGSFTVLRPNIDCHSIDTGNFLVYKFFVKPFIIDDNLWKEISLLPNPLVINFEGDDFQHITRLFESLIYEQNKREKYSTDICRYLINSILSFFTERISKGNENIKRGNLIAYLLENDRYLTDVSLKDFADDFGYSLSHASKYFKENSGMTFMEAKQFFRIQFAKRLLLSTDLSINEISSKCGFNYYPLFHNLFKNTTKMTPLEFRKGNR